MRRRPCITDDASDPCPPHRRRPAAGGDRGGRDLAPGVGARIGAARQPRRSAAQHLDARLGQRAARRRPARLLGRARVLPARRHRRVQRTPARHHAVRGPRLLAVAERGPDLQRRLPRLVRARRAGDVAAGAAPHRPHRRRADRGPGLCLSAAQDGGAAHLPPHAGERLGAALLLGAAPLRRAPPAHRRAARVRVVRAGGPDEPLLRVRAARAARLRRVRAAPTSTASARSTPASPATPSWPRPWPRRSSRRCCCATSASRRRTGSSGRRRRARATAPTSCPTSASGTSPASGRSCATSARWSAPSFRGSSSPAWPRPRFAGAGRRATGRWWMWGAPIAGVALCGASLLRRTVAGRHLGARLARAARDRAAAGDDGGALRADRGARVPALARPGAGVRRLGDRAERPARLAASSRFPAPPACGCRPATA